MLHMKHLNSKKTHFPRFDKILVIQPIAEVYGEGNERQLCQEIVSKQETHSKIFRLSQTESVCRRQFPAYLII